MDWSSVRRIHVLGVCGTGMGTFAGMLKERGFEVTGSDQGVYPPMSTSLADWGVPVFEGYRPENLDPVDGLPAPDVVVVGNVIRRVNPEATEMRRRGLSHTSFPDAFARLFLHDRRPMVVAGTHGKTTTTSMLAWLLHDTGHDPGLLVGGLPANFPRSYRAGSAPHFVIEGDEYDTAYFDKGPKFLHYRPHHAILTNVEFDHADIYADVQAVERAFERFVALVPEDGSLTVCGEEERAVRIARRAAQTRTVETYGRGPDCDWRVEDVTEEPGGTRFRLTRGDAEAGRFLLPMFGVHNVLNATAALVTALRVGVEPEPLAAALATFRGIKKRQEFKGEARGVRVYDDFAHHPTAVRETISALRRRHPEGRLWAVYHPESNTARRKVFEREYGAAFDDADVALLAKAHVKKDGLPPEERIDLAAVVDAIRARGVEAQGDLTVDEIVTRLAAEVRPGDIVLGMSGRDFEGLHARLLDALASRSRRQPS